MNQFQQTKIPYKMLQDLHFVSPQKSQYFTVIPICSIETLSQVFINFKGTTVNNAALSPLFARTHP